MTQIRLAFHADPTEVGSLVWRWTHDHRYFFAAETFAPTYEVRPLTGQAELLAVASDNVSRISVSRRPFEFDAKRSLDFADSNPDALRFTIGRHLPAGIQESSLGAIADDVTVLRDWVSIRRRADLDLLRGAVLASDATGRRDFKKSHRFTEAAFELCRQGVRMISANGPRYFELGVTE